MDPECCFCSEFKSGRMPDHFIAKAGLAARIVAQTDNFLALPSVSPLARGHLLILPRSHISSMTQLPPQHFDEFLGFAREHCRRVEERLGSVLVFEHGVGRGKAGGCGVDHAHLHILPLSPSGAERVRALVNARYPLRSTASFDLVRYNIPNGRSYLTLGTGIDQLSHAMSESIPSQYLRTIIARELGAKLSDWKQFFGWREFVETTELLATQPAKGRSASLRQY